MTSLWRKIRSTLKKNRKEKPGKFRGEETMLMYITTSEMLEEERMQEILRADTKKERRLCLFCKRMTRFLLKMLRGCFRQQRKWKSCQNAVLRAKICFYRLV